MDVGSGGTVLQVDSVVHGSVAVVGILPSIVSALTRTGITSPVLREKDRCPRTVSSSACTSILLPIFHIFPAAEDDKGRKSGEN